MKPQEFGRFFLCQFYPNLMSILCQSAFSKSPPPLSKQCSIKLQNGHSIAPLMGTSSYPCPSKMMKVEGFPLFCRCDSQSSFLNTNKGTWTFLFGTLSSKVFLMMYKMCEDYVPPSSQIIDFLGGKSYLMEIYSAHRAEVCSSSNLWVVPDWI